MKLDKTDRLFLNCKLSRWSGTLKTCRWCDRSLPKHHRKWCSDRCKWAGWENHSWTFARSAALSRDLKTCQKCGASKVYVEVNHIVPVLGKHSQNGCWHHLKGLETVCGPCHKNITKVQRAQGMFQRK